LQELERCKEERARLPVAEDVIGILTPGREASFILIDRFSVDIRNTETIVAVWKTGKQVSAGPLAVTPAHRTEPHSSFGAAGAARASLTSVNIGSV
jgi:hypothetical protein